MQQSIQLHKMTIVQNIILDNDNGGEKWHAF